MALKAGMIDNMADSMAAAMEAAFLEEWPKAMGDQEKPDMNDQMRLMFVAMAKGVVRHLVANPDAFLVKITPFGIDGWGQHTHEASLTIEGS